MLNLDSANSIVCGIITASLTDKSPLVSCVMCCYVWPPLTRVNIHTLFSISTANLFQLPSYLQRLSVENDESSSTIEQIASGSKFQTLLILTLTLFVREGTKRLSAVLPFSSIRPVLLVIFPPQCYALPFLILPHHSTLLVWGFPLSLFPSKGNSILKSLIFPKDVVPSKPTVFY